MGEICEIGEDKKSLSGGKGCFQLVRQPASNPCKLVYYILKELVFDNRVGIRNLFNWPFIK